MTKLKDYVIGVVGGGVVGSATARSYLEHVKEVRVFDIDSTKATAHLSDTLQSDLIFVCLPTPQEAGKLKCNLNYVEDFFNSVSETHKHQNFVLRSTVPIGTTLNLVTKYRFTNLVHSPEFLTARCAVVDAQIPSRNIIGLTRETRINEGDCWDELFGLYSQRFPGSNTMLMTSSESEAVKLVQNSFFAVKVAFWNEMYGMAKQAKLNWGNVMRGILADGRIHPSHTNVPGPDGKFGFGGTCLPKDLASVVHTIRVQGYTPFVTGAALTRNQDADRPEGR